ncbi:hypothetical protein INP11_13525, partial [Staphylococcus aureus]|nr:hypothetical protein [Staphylococcus aureus]
MTDHQTAIETYRAEGLTQAQMAERLGITIGRVNQIAKGRTGKLHAVNSELRCRECRGKAT